MPVMISFFLQGILLPFHAYQTSLIKYLHLRVQNYTLKILFPLDEKLRDILPLDHSTINHKHFSVVG